MTLFPITIPPLLDSSAPSEYVERNKAKQAREDLIAPFTHALLSPVIHRSAKSEKNVLMRKSGSEQI